MASGIFTTFKTDVMTAKNNLGASGDSVLVVLMASGYSPNYTTDTTYSTTNEVATGNGYTRGGISITSGMSVSAASGNAKWTSTVNPVWTSSGAGFTAYYALVYDATNSNHVICAFDFGGAQTVSGGATFTITWNASGIITLS